MFRPAALIVATLLGLGPSAGLLCKAFCSPALAAAAACHTPHDLTATGLGHSADCGAVSGRLTSMPAEGARVDASSNADPATTSLLAGTIALRVGLDPGGRGPTRAVPPGPRQLSPALRL